MPDPRSQSKTVTKGEDLEDLGIMDFYMMGNSFHGFLWNLIPIKIVDKEISSHRFQDLTVSCLTSRFQQLDCQLEPWENFLSTISSLGYSPPLGHPPRPWTLRVVPWGPKGVVSG